MSHTEREHAVLSPSFLKIALQCSGSVPRKEGLPPQKQTSASARGTRIHEACEIILTDFLAHKTDGTDPEIRAHLLLDPEEKKLAEQWRDLVWKEAFQGSITGKTAYAIEDRITYSEKYSSWGTTDFWMVAFDERAKRYGVIYDIKSGYVFVDAKDNPQLASYALCLREEARRLGKDLDYVIGGIWQPYGEGEKFRTVKFTSRQLDVWEKKIIKLGQAVFGGTTKLKAGTHCEYCPTKIGCPAFDKHLHKETSLAFIEPKEITFPTPSTLPNDVLVKINKAEGLLDSFMKDVKRVLYNKLVAGEKIEGVKLVEANTKRKWTEDLLPELEAALKPHKVSLYEPSPKGLTAIKDELAEHLTKKEAEELINAFVTKPPGAIVMAEASDRRPEVSNTHNVFTEITTDE